MTDRPNLTCDEVRDLAPLFVTGALDEDEMDAVREHIADCDDQHVEIAELGEAATALLESAEPAEPPGRAQAAPHGRRGRRPGRGPAPGVDPGFV